MRHARPRTLTFSPTWARRLNWPRPSTRRASKLSGDGGILATLTEPGGSLLKELPPVAPSEALFGRILAQLPEPAARPAYTIPASVRALLPREPEKAWRGVLKSGVRFLELVAAEAHGVKLYLVHLRAGAAFPHHAHGGLEEAVILAGGAQDGAEVLEAGDWRVYPPGSDHQPKALPDEDCWLLVRLEEGLQLSGWRGLLQKF